MQFDLSSTRKSEEEYIKEKGLFIDYDEIAKKGKMSGEESLISKWYGVYQSRQTGDHMARVVIPGGKLTSSQARCIASASEKYASGLLSITTRQALQLHKLQITAIPEFMRDLTHHGLSTFHGCGDVVRTIPACTLAQSCKYARFNVLPYAVDAMKYLTDLRDLDNLPRKLKINFSGCNAGCGQTHMNCVGLNAVIEKIDNKEYKGFKVVIGGGMGWKAFVGQDLFGFVREDLINKVLRAIALLFRDHGDRFNRSKSRLKFIVERLGIEKCREIVMETLHKEKVDVSGIIAGPIDDLNKTTIPKRPLIEQNKAGTDGKVCVRVIVPKGEIKADDLKQVAKLSEMYGDQHVYTDNRQNLSIHGVEIRNVEKLAVSIKEMGFKTDGYFGLDDIVCCVGKTYCPKAVTFTRELFDLLCPVVSSEKYSAIRYKGIINITGCPNSCSPYRIADIGFRGARIREKTGSVEGYEILLGGSQTDHGKKLGDFKKEDCPDIVGKILDLFIRNSAADEYINEYVQRVGIDYVKQEVLQ